MKESTRSNWFAKCGSVMRAIRALTLPQDRISPRERINVDTKYGTMALCPDFERRKDERRR
jgi:hypothetical protein